MKQHRCCNVGALSTPGTGTVIVRLTDVNDNSPKLLQREWRLQIPETNGLGPPSDQSLLDLAVTDPDRANYFFYRVSGAVSIYNMMYKYIAVSYAGSGSVIRSAVYNTECKFTEITANFVI